MCFGIVSGKRQKLWVSVLQLEKFLSLTLITLTLGHNVMTPGVELRVKNWLSKKKQPTTLPYLQRVLRVKRCCIYVYQVVDVIPVQKIITGANNQAVWNQFI